LGCLAGIAAPGAEREGASLDGLSDGGVAIYN
jgi:hypothetical protein